MSRRVKDFQFRVYDCEGFDYFFCHYARNEDLPKGLRKLASEYVSIAKRLKEAVAKLTDDDF